MNEPKFRNIDCHRYDVCLGKAAKSNSKGLHCFYCKNKNVDGYSMDKEEIVGLLRLVLHTWCGIDKHQTDDVVLRKLIDNRC